MDKLKCLLFSLILCFAFPLLNSAQYIKVENTQDFMDKASSLSETTQSMKSDFVQEKHLSFMSEPIISKGVFQYKLDNKIRWQYTSPFNYLLILNNGKLLVDDEGNQNKIDLSNNEMFKQINDIISNALTGNVFDNPEQFNNTIEESKDSFRVSLTPKNKDLEIYIKEIKIILSKETMLVKEVKLIELSDDFTKISFLNNKINNKIDDSVFELNH